MNTPHRDFHARKLTLLAALLIAFAVTGKLGGGIVVHGGSLADAQEDSAVFGNPSIGPGGDTAGSGYKFGSVYPLSVAGTAVSFSFYVQGGSAPQRFVPVVYAVDSSGNPATLVANGAEVLVSAGQAAGWVTSALPSVALSSGSYLLGLMSGPNNASATLRFNSTTNGAFWNGNTYGSPTSNWGQINRAHATYSFYLTYIPDESASAAPANTTVPVISGATTVGQQLSANTGEWTGDPTSYAYQWRKCNSSGTGCSDIAGATTGTYTLVSGDAGFTIRVAVTATNGGGSSVATSSPTGTVTSAPVAPSNTVPPAIDGTPEVGRTLTATSGTWSGNPPPSLSRQWRSCQSSVCSNIAGATGTSYVVASADVGRNILIVVTASNSSGTAQATSQQTAVVTSPAASSGAFGTTVPGTLADSPGSGYKFGSVYVLDRTATATRFRWYARGGTASQSFTPIIYNANAAGQPTTVVAQGQLVTVAAQQPAGWVSSPLPSGVTLQTGKYMLALLGGGAGQGAFNYYEDGPADASYWNHNGSAVPSSSWGALYTSPQQWSFRVEYTSGTSPAVPTATSAPTITGEAVVGRSLAATPGTWANDPTSYAYQWQRCNSSGAGCSNLSGTAASVYTVVAADAGNTIRVVVTATNGAGSGTATSAPTAVVTSRPVAPSNNTPPTISGATQVGDTLTASPGSWNGNPTPVLSPQWQACANSVCANIAGASSWTYRIAAADEGHSLRVVVTASNTEGSAQAASAPTNPVTAPNGEVNTVSFKKIVVDPNPIGSVIEKTLADINRDGRLDVVIGMQPSPPQGGTGGIFWYQYPASGNPSDAWIKRTILPSGTAYEDMSSLDVDNDGWVDILASVNRNVYWYRNPGTTSSTWQQTLIGGPGHGENTLVIADLDGDGRPDVATNNIIFFQNTPGSWTAKVYNNSYNSVALLDTGSGLGRISLAGNQPVSPFDIAWFQNPRERGGNARTGSWTMHIVGPGYPCPPDLCSSEGTVATAWTGDFNGDGRTDIAAAQAEGEPAPPGGLKWFEAPEDRTQPWTSHDIDATLESAHNIRVADFDGNGALDITGGEQDQSDTKRIVVYYNDGVGNFTRQVLSNDASHNVEVGDVEGDGDIDILAGPHGYFGDPHPIQLYLNGRF